MRHSLHSKIITQQKAALRAMRKKLELPSRSLPKSTFTEAVFAVCEIPGIRVDTIVDKANAEWFEAFYRKYRQYCNSDKRVQKSMSFVSFENMVTTRYDNQTRFMREVLREIERLIKRLESRTLPIDYRW